MEFSKIQTGEVLSSTMYLTVVSKDSDSIKVKDSFGREFVVKGPKLIEETMTSAIQFSKEEKVSNTKAAEALVAAGDTAFTVVFIKEDGKERTLTGRLVETENLMGRSNVIDLQIATGYAMRQVNLRELKSVVLKGTKYTVKK